MAVITMAADTILSVSFAVHFRSGRLLVLILLGSMEDVLSCFQMKIETLSFPLASCQMLKITFNYVVML